MKVIKLKNYNPEASEYDSPVFVNVAEFPRIDETVKFMATYTKNGVTGEELVRARIQQVVHLNGEMTFHAVFFKAATDDDNWY